MKITNTKKAIDMSNIQGNLQDQLGNNLIPNTLASAVYDQAKGRTQSAENATLEASMGYFVCDTAAATAEKTIAATGYILATGGSIKVMMVNDNTAANATLNINGTGAKPLFYNGVRVGTDNTWLAGETLNLFYDGTNWMATSVIWEGGVFDISAFNPTNGQPTPYASLSAALGTNGVNVPAAYRKGGMSIKFVQSDDNKYVQWKCTNPDLPNGFTFEGNWELEITNRNLSEDFLGVLSEVTEFPIKGNIILSNGKFSSSGTYTHAALPVNEGEIYYITGTGATLPASGARVAFATSDSANNGSTVPIVPGTSIMTLNSYKYYTKFVIPSGCKYLLFNLSNTGGDYGIRCYRHYDSVYDSVSDWYVGGFVFVGDGSTNRKNYNITVKSNTVYEISLGNINMACESSISNAYIKLRVSVVDSENTELTSLLSIGNQWELSDKYYVRVPDYGNNTIFLRIGLLGAAGEMQTFTVREATGRVSEINNKLKKGEPVSLKTWELGLISDFNPTVYRKRFYANVGESYNNIQHTSSGYEVLYYNISLSGYKALDIFYKESALNYSYMYGGLVIYDSNDEAIVDQTCPYTNQKLRITVTANSSHALIPIYPTTMSSGDYILTIYPDTLQKDVQLEIGGEYVFDFNNELYKPGYISLSYFSLGNTSGLGRSIPRGTNLYSLPYSRSDSDYVVQIIPCNECDTLWARAFRTSADYVYGVFCDSNLNIISNHYNTHTSGTIVELEVPEGAEYFAYTFPPSWMTSEATNHPYIKIGNKGIRSNITKLNNDVEQIKQRIGGSLNSGGSTIILESGAINTDGDVIESETTLHTSPIYGGRGFFLTLNPGYEIYAAHLYSNNNILISYNYLPPNLGGPFSVFIGEDGIRGFYGSDAIPAGHYLLIEIKKYVGEVSVGLSVNENIIKEFCYLDDGRLSIEEHEVQKWGYAVKKINQLARVKWTPKAYVYPSGYNTYADYFFYKGKTRFGIPYSEPAQFSKYVGQHVTLYTFLTAVNNPRSVMYTERIQSGGTSEYGFVYAGLANTYCGPFYGTVCTGLTGYVAGHDNVFISGAYAGLKIPGMTRVNNPDSQNVKPLDFIWNDGHCSVIKDIILSEYGERKFIIWAEMTKPTPFITPYTPEMFEERLRIKECRVYRYNGFADALPPENAPFVQDSWMDYPRELQYNNDICTMYGDKPCIAVGDILWLNFNKIKNYTGIVIEKKTDNAWNIISTITLSGNSNVREVQTDSTYNDYNLADANLTEGMYRAKMIGAENLESDYTYWEMIGITIGATKTAIGIDVSFSATSGTPYLIREEKGSGYMEVVGGERNHSITAAEITAGTISLPWMDYQSNTFVKVFVRGEYGVAVKTVSCPT